MKKIITVFVILVVSVSYAQNLSGRIVDSEGNPLSDVGVFNKTSGQITTASLKNLKF